MRILLTGSHGFLGRHVKEALESAGHEVWCYSRRVNTVGDSCVAHADLLINCAGEVTDKTQMCAANLEFAADLLRASVAFDKRLIHVGSLIEDLPLDTIYHATKRAATQLCVAYARELGAKVSVIRPSTLYGYGDRPEAFFPTLWRAHVENTPVRIANEFRGWIHVTDAARAVLALAQDPLAVRGIYDANTDYIHNLAIFDLFSARVGGTIQADLRDQREEGTGWPRHSCRAIRDTGWKPLYDMEFGVAEFVAQMQGGGGGEGAGTIS